MSSCYTSLPVEMCADHSHSEDLVQVCTSLYPSSMYVCSMPHDRTSHCTQAPHSVPHHLYLHITHQNPLFLPSPLSLPPPSWCNRNWDSDPLNKIRQETDITEYVAYLTVATRSSQDSSSSGQSTCS